MSHHSSDIHKVTDIIKVLNGGIEFYRDGIEKVSTGSVIAMFNRMIEEKQRAVIDLQQYAIEEQGKPEKDLSYSVKIRTMYTKLIGVIGSDNETTYISQLEEVEDSVLEAFDDALSEDQSAECASELRKLRTRMQQCHDEMKSLKHATS